MRVLVIGASGYIGSRTIPVLIDAGHDVLAGARDVDSLNRFHWSLKVRPMRVDVLDELSIAKAISNDVDAIVYLVHGMADNDFAQADHQAAQNVVKAVDKYGISRIVYVSGIIPDISDQELSEHLRSRLDVERTLSTSKATVITLRAAMVLGGGSTSFELMSQLANRLPLTIVPDWMNHLVEPIAVSDLAKAINGALEVDVSTRHYDIGGGEPLPYPDLIHQYMEITGRERLQLPLGSLPEKLVAQVAAWVADIPSPTVKALMESLQHDMTAQERDWLSDLQPEGSTVVSVHESLKRSSTDASDEQPDNARDPLQKWSSDPQWV